MLAEATIATAISVPARRAHRPPGRGHPTPDQAGGGAAPALPSAEPAAVLGPHRHLRARGPIPPRARAVAAAGRADGLPRGGEPDAPGARTGGRGSGRPPAALPGLDPEGPGPRPAPAPHRPGRAGGDRGRAVHGRGAGPARGASEGHREHGAVRAGGPDGRRARGLGHAGRAAGGAARGAGSGLPAPGYGASRGGFGSRGSGGGDPAGRPRPGAGHRHRRAVPDGLHPAAGRRSHHGRPLHGRRRGQGGRPAVHHRAAPLRDRAAPGGVPAGPGRGQRP